MTAEQFTTIHAELMTRRAGVEIEINNNTLIVKAWQGGATKRIYVSKGGQQVGYYDADGDFIGGRQLSQYASAIEAQMGAALIEMFIPAPIVEVEAAQAVVVTEATAAVEVVEVEAVEITAPAELTEGAAFTLDGKPAVIRNGKIFAALHPGADDSETGTGCVKLGWKIISQYNTAARWVAKGFGVASLDIETQQIYARIGGLPAGVQAPDYAAWSAFYGAVYANS